MADPIETAQKINELLSERKKTLQEISNLESRSVATARNIAAAVSRIGDTSQANKSLETTNALIEALGASAKKATEEGGAGMDKMSGQIANAVKQSGALGKQLTMLDKMTTPFALGLIAGLDGALQGFKFSIHTSQRFFGVLKQGVKTVANFGMSLISLPFKLLSHLMDQVTQGSNEFRTELENIRKNFGDLAQNESKAIISGFRKVQGELSNTGLSVTRTMGFFVERLKEVHRMARELGPVFFRLKDELASSAEEFFAYQKGLGLSEQAMVALGQRALSMGTTFQEQGRRITSTAYQMGEAFGINGKNISRDVGEMMADFKNFGSIAPEVLAGISVYAKKLGVDIKGLLGVIDKFDNFENAADSVAQLNQAFGLNIDVLEQVKDQDPASRMERLRKAFFATGKSIENMTRQERALLAQQTGLDDATLSLAFSQKSQAVSYADIQKQAQATQKTQLTQAEAMQKLSNSIERLVRQGAQLNGSFLQIFLKGFEKGIERSWEFRKVIMNLRRAMQDTFYTGIRVGRDFMKFFPGVADMFKGLAELFERGRWKKMLGSVRESFRDFFKDMSTNPQTALPNLLKKLKANFFDFFDTQSSTGRKVLDGFKTFSKSMLVIFGQIGLTAVKGITKGIKFLADFITNPSAAIANLKSGAGAAGGFFGEIFGALAPAGNELVSNVLPKLWEAIKSLFGAVAKRAEPYLKKALPWIAGFFVGPSALGFIARGIGGALATALAGVIARAVRNAFAGRAAKAAAEKGLDGLSKTVANAATGTSAAKNMKGIGEATAAAASAGEVAQKSRITGAAVGKMVLIGTLITVGISAIALAMAGVATIIQQNNIKPGTLAATAGIFVASGLVMAEVAGIMYILASVGQLAPAMGLQIAIGLGTVALVAVGMGYAATQMIDTFKGYKQSDINKASKVMLATSGIFLAASAVTAVAAGVGTVVLATAGVGGAAIAAGFDAIQGVIIKMSGTIMGIIESVKTIPTDANFQRQTQTFTTILGTVGEMAGSIASIMEAATPSVGELLFGGPSFTQKLDQTKKFIQSLGGEMTGIIDTFVEQSKALSNRGEGAMKGAETLASTLGSVMTAAKALQPPPELFDTGWLDTLTGDTATNRIRALGDYISQISTALSGTFRTVGEQFSKLSQGLVFGEDAQRAATVISEILRSISSLASGMANVIRRQYGNDAEDLADVAPRLRTFISAFVQGVLGRPGEPSIFSAASDLVKRIAQETQGLSEGQARVVADVSKAIGSVFLAIGTLAELLAFQDTFKNLPQGQTIAGELRSISEGFFGPLLGAVSGIIQVSVESFKDLRQSSIKNLKSGFEALGDFFGLITRIPEMFKSLREFGQGGNERAGYGEVAGRLKAFQGFIYGDGNFNVVNFISGLIPKLEVFNSMPRGINAKVEAFSKSLDAITKIPQAFSAINDSVQVFEQLKGPEGSIATRVESMIESVNEISDSLKGVRFDNVNLSLKRLASDLGLSSTKRQEYTIRNRSFKVDLTVNVKLDADEFEDHLIGRPGGTRFTVDPDFKET